MSDQILTTTTNILDRAKKHWMDCVKSDHASKKTTIKDEGKGEQEEMLCLNILTYHPLNNIDDETGSFIVSYISKINTNLIIKH